VGADGHIRLMDWNKFECISGLDIGRALQFFDCIRDSVTYFQRLEERCIITCYWGDNLYCVSHLEELVNHGWERGNWNDGFYYEGLLARVEKNAFDKDGFVRLCQLLWNDCYINQWEVWT
jgi:hypothetical protein